MRCILAVGALTLITACGRGPVPGDGAPTANCSNDSNTCTGTTSVSESDNCTVLTSSAGTITDGDGNTWQLGTASDGSYAVELNGAPAGFTIQVIKLVYVNHTVAQENVANDWWSWTGDWTSIGDPTASCAGNGTQPAAPELGANLPFITIEAESGTVNGSVVTLQGLPAVNAATPEREASNHAFVQLDATGDYLELSAVPAANTLVIRHCIPDAAAGGGLTNTLSWSVNGVARPPLTLSSYHNWLYGDVVNNGQSNDPQDGDAHVYWDETRYVVDAIPAGATVRFEKNAGDTAAFYRLDLFDFEVAPTALAPPAAGTYVDLGTYAQADASGATDSTAALITALADAKAQHKVLWVPAGTFVISGAVSIDAVVLQGAGQWHTTIFRNTPMPKPAGPGGAYVFAGMGLTGDGAGIKDVFIDSTGRGRNDIDSGDYGLLGEPTNFVVDHLWITHTGSGLWLGGAHGVIRNSRVRFTYADGININNGAVDITVENNHVRGSGDDGIAVLSETNDGKPPTDGIIVRYNTVINPWWAANIDIAGGTSHVVEHNLLVENWLGGCLDLNSPNAYPMEELVNTSFTANRMLRCGNNGFDQHRGAIWTFAESAPFSAITFTDNVVDGSLTTAIDVHGPEQQELTFIGTLIDMHGGGEDAVRIGSEASGSGTFTDTVISNLSSSFEALDNQAANFAISGNSF